MSKAVKKNISGRDKRHRRVRKRVAGTAQKPRLSVYRSLKHIYAQLVDDLSGTTLGAASTKTEALAGSVKGMKGKVDPAHLVGKEIARIALEKNINTVVFDRSGYRYHGRIKAVAEGAREGGLIF
jgi:large subunit ribosomal protein L18